MLKENEKENNEPKEEMVRVDGLEFPKYLFECMKSFALMYGMEDVKEWLQNRIVYDLLIPYLSGDMPKDYCDEVIEKLKKNGYDVE